MKGLAFRALLSDWINIQILHKESGVSTLTKVGLVLTTLDLHTSRTRLDQEVSHQLLQWIPWERDELCNDLSAKVYTDISIEFRGQKSYLCFRVSWR